MVAPPCCAVCGRLQSSLKEALQTVQFADYQPSRQPPEPDDDTGVDPIGDGSVRGNH